MKCEWSFIAIVVLPSTHSDFSSDTNNIEVVRKQITYETPIPARPFDMKCGLCKPFHIREANTDSS